MPLFLCYPCLLLTTFTCLRFTTFTFSDSPLSLFLDATFLPRLHSLLPATSFLTLLPRNNFLVESSQFLSHRCQWRHTSPPPSFNQQPAKRWISRDHSTSPFLSAFARLCLTFHPQSSSFRSPSNNFLVSTFSTSLTSIDRLPLNQQPTKRCISRRDHWNSPFARLNLTFLYFLPTDSSLNSPSFCALIIPWSAFFSISLPAFFNFFDHRFFKFLWPAFFNFFDQQQRSPLTVPTTGFVHFI